MAIISAYCDGGVIGRNPSSIGGTWAYVFVDENDQKVAGSSNRVLVGDAPWLMPRITNNFTELLGALKAMEALPDGWDGTIYTDSQVTYRRIIRGSSFAGIPSCMEEMVRHHRKRLSHRVVLISGHPSEKDLRLGVTKKGRMCSKWNVACDRQCTQLVNVYRKEMRRQS